MQGNKKVNQWVPIMSFDIKFFISAILFYQDVVKMYHTACIFNRSVFQCNVIVAACCKSTVIVCDLRQTWNIRSSQLTEEAAHSTEHHIKVKVTLINILIMLSWISPSYSWQVVFIDEIDSICRKRSIREEEYTRRIKTELLKQVSGCIFWLLCSKNKTTESDSNNYIPFYYNLFLSTNYCIRLWFHKNSYCKWNLEQYYDSMIMYHNISQAASNPKFRQYIGEQVKHTHCTRLGGRAMWRALKIKDCRQ